MSIWSAASAIYGAYSPNAASANRNRRAARFGAFQPTMRPPVLHRRPKDDREAQRLYNHVRTVAFYLDAAPMLSDLGLPFRAGLDDIISLVPIWGDVLSGLMQLYQVWLAWIFGVPVDVCVRMVSAVPASHLATNSDAERPLHSTRSPPAGMKWRGACMPYEHISPLSALPRGAHTTDHKRRPRRRSRRHPLRR